MRKKLSSDDLTDSIFSPRGDSGDGGDIKSNATPRRWRPSDKYHEQPRAGEIWLLLGVFFSGVVCGVALSIAVTYVPW